MSSNFRFITLHQPDQGTNARHRGFTLLELLVVVAIIALLAAILFPVFVKVREKARSATCQSNLNQMGLAEMQYAQDNDEYFTGAGIKGPYTAYDHITWMEELYPYTKDADVFLCPSETHGEGTLANAAGYNCAGLQANADVFNQINVQGICYAYNYTFGQFLNPNYWATGEPIGSPVSYPSENTMGSGGIINTAVQQPSQTIMIADTNSQFVQGGNPNSATTTFYNQYQWWFFYVSDMDPQAQNQWRSIDGEPVTDPGLLTTPHTGGFNVLYYDGHVKWKVGTNAYEWYLNKATAKSHGFTD